MLDILEENKDYKVYRFDYLTEGSNLKFEHSVYCEDVDISSFIAQGEEKIQAMRQDSIEGEKKAYDIVVAAAKQWEQQAAVTQRLDRALAYLRTPEVKHTGNCWQPFSNNKDWMEISNRVSIYQLDMSDNADNLRFMSLDWLERKGLSVDRDNYQMVYAMQREPGETLEDIYRRFNIDHPEDFKGHSLSVSDVVVLHGNGADAAWYVDSIGFKELPDFFGAGTPEAKRDVSVREQLDNARKQAAQTGPKAPDKKPREPERS